MNPVVAVGRLLAERFGLSLELLRDGTVERALEAALAKTTSSTGHAEEMARLLQGEGDAWQILVEEVLVPETWFFRDTEPFRLLGSFVKKEWRPANPLRTFKVLSVPCASGEEPYSVAMTLLDSGLEPGKILIDAGDASERSLARAKSGVYGRMSFREKSSGVPDRYFVRCPEGLELKDEVKRLVDFENVNLLDLSIYRSRAPYDAIFCRNALIYLDEGARRRVLQELRDLLHENGLLFTGHTELFHFLEAGYEPVDHPLSFACRLRRTPRERPSAGTAATLPAPARLRPKTKHSRAIAAKIVTAETTAHAPPPPPGLEQAERLADRGELPKVKLKNWKGRISFEPFLVLGLSKRK